MNESFYALLRDIFTSLERFLIGFAGYLSGQTSEKQKMILKATETRLKALEDKERIKSDVKKISDTELARDTVDD